MWLNERLRGLGNLIEHPYSGQAAGLKPHDSLGDQIYDGGGGTSPMEKSETKSAKGAEGGASSPKMSRGRFIFYLCLLVPGLSFLLAACKKGKGRRDHP